MDDPVVVSLVVSGVGMLVLFLALAFLYGLMYLMTAFIQDRSEPETQKQDTAGGEREARGERQKVGGREQEVGSEKRRMAVIGVALARAELEMNSIDASDVKVTPSGWRALHQRRQLTLNTTMEMRTRTRRRR